jgi:hypothetical protein
VSAPSGPQREIPIALWAAAGLLLVAYVAWRLLH